MILTWSYGVNVTGRSRGACHEPVFPSLAFVPTAVGRNVAGGWPRRDPRINEGTHPLGARTAAVPAWMCLPDIMGWRMHL